MATKKKPVKKAAPKKKAIITKKGNSRRDNKNQRNNRSGENGCYFTTACCTYKGLSDNCYQLNLLRDFRDKVMRQTSNGKKIIDQYYLVAPKIVNKINESEDTSIEYDLIFKHINETCRLIKASKGDEAIICYSNMVNYLIMKYLN